MYDIFFLNWINQKKEFCDGKSVIVLAKIYPPRDFSYKRYFIGLELYNILRRIIEPNGDEILFFSREAEQ